MTTRTAATSRQILSRFSRLLPAVVVALAAPACEPKADTASKGEEAKPVAVTAADVKHRTLDRTVPVVGTLFPYEDVTLAPRVSGRVLRVFKDVGERVGPGERLLELDPAEYTLAVEQAEPAFEAELRKLKLTALPATDAAFERHLPAVDAVNEAYANLKFAQSELERSQREIGGGVGSKQALDSAVNKVAVATVRVQLAVTDARVTLANARRLRAALDDARRKLAETRLNAPSPDEWTEWVRLLGTTATPLQYAVAQKMVSAGEMVQSTPVTNCYRLVIDHYLKLGAAIPEKHAPEVAVGQPVTVRVEAYPNKVFTGAVARISPTTDAGNRTFGVVIGIRNGDGKLKAGGFATAKILTGTDTVATVPPEALVQFAGVNKVFVIDGDRARAVEVIVGTRDPEWVEVGGRYKLTDRALDALRSRHLPDHVLSKLKTLKDQLKDEQPQRKTDFAREVAEHLGAGETDKLVERVVEQSEVGGLPAGAKVITSGQSQLVDGSAIRIK
jgi:multidrug efflux pump subunit AcrA (membrane-fusion protein)